MVRKKKQSEDTALPADEAVIEGSAEHIPDEDINEDIVADVVEDVNAGDDQAEKQHQQNQHHQSARPSRLRRLGIALLLLAGLAILAAAISLGLINRQAIDAVNSNLAMQATSSQQQASQLNQIEAELGALNSADAADTADIADKDAALAQRLDALENQIAALRTELTTLEDQLARLPATPETAPDAQSGGQSGTADDMMIMAEQLAELEQRVNKLAGQLDEQASPLQLPDQDQLEDQLESQAEDQAEDQNTTDDGADDALSPDLISPDPITSDRITLETMFNRITVGQPFADVLDIMAQDHPALSELRPWADAPPASLSALWVELDQLLTDHLNPNTDTDTNTSDDSWWGWLMAPLSDAIKITPITPQLEAKTMLTKAWQDRDADLAIKAAAELAETHPALADWHDAMLRRQALDQVANKLAAILEE